MLRCVIRKPGGYKALRIIEELDPEPGAGEALVRVAAAGVNYADAVVRMGYYGAAKGKYPITPGFEFSGTVEKLGPFCAARFLEGQSVFGVARFGGYASKVCVPEAQLWRVPEGWTPSQAAAFPAVMLTAYHGLFQVAKVEPGETLLVHSAAGGAGMALTMLAKEAGCRVVGVVGGAHKVEAARLMRPDAVIDKSAGPLWEEAERLSPEGYDAVFDANGGPSLVDGFRRLRPGGRLVVYGFASMLPKGRGRPRLASLALAYLRRPRFDPLEMTASNRSVCGFNVVYLFDRFELARRAMERMIPKIATGALRPLPVKTYPFAEAARAHRDLESGTTTGKLALEF